MKNRTKPIRNAKPLEERVLAYVVKVISNSKVNRCGVSQETIRKALKVRKQSVADALRCLVESGKLVRSTANNRNRPNQKHYYHLPDNAGIVQEGMIPEVHKVVSKLKTMGDKKVVPDTEKVVPKTEPRELSGNSIKESIPSGSQKLFAGKTLKAKNAFDITKLAKDSDRVQQIEIYLDAGLHLTPLAEADKVPLAGWTKEKSASTSKSEMLDFFRSNPNCNVGCWLPEEIIVIDADDYVRLFRNSLRMGGDVQFELSGTLRCITGRTDNTGMHLWFRNTHNISSRTKVGGFVDYKAGGSLIVLPPSRHKSGRKYVWDKIVEPLDVPSVFANAPEIPKGTSNNVLSLSLRRVKRGVSPQPFITKSTELEEGERYNELFRKGRSLRFSMNAEELEAELHRYNQICCTKPLDEHRMRKLVADVRFGNNRRDFKAKRV